MSACLSSGLTGPHPHRMCVTGALLGGTGPKEKEKKDHYCFCLEQHVEPQPWAPGFSGAVEGEKSSFFVLLSREACTLSASYLQ